MCTLRFTSLSLIECLYYPKTVKSVRSHQRIIILGFFFFYYLLLCGFGILTGQRAFLQLQLAGVRFADIAQPRHETRWIPCERELLRVSNSKWFRLIYTGIDQYCWRSVQLPGSRWRKHRNLSRTHWTSSRSKYRFGLIGVEDVIRLQRR